MTAEPQLILIAEHDLQVRELQRFFLEKAGFRVAFCASGLDALAAVATARPRAVVTEILLPGLDGLTLCRRLRDDEATRAIPVVVFSMLAAGARAADAGAAAFLRKPIVESTFVATIRGAIASASPAAKPHGPQEPQWVSMS